MVRTNLLIPTYMQMLAALSGWLEKARAERGDAADALLAARLAPDMFPLSTQVRFACVQALEGVSRLRGEDFPPAVGLLLAEGRNAGEQPGTIPDAVARIDETLAMLEAVPAGALDRDPETPLAHALPSGMIFDLTAGQYARDWTLSQFYFHLMIAYAILRHEGVALGKVDYIPHMLAHIRPAPGAGEGGAKHAKS